MRQFASISVLISLALAGQVSAQTNYPYVIKTFAGSFPLGDGGAATSALLEFPSAVVSNNAGILYVADSGNGIIRKIESGVISTVSGFKGFATDLSVDASGNLYICSGSVVYKMTPGGVISRFAGNGGFGFSGDGGPATSATLNDPQGIALDKSGNLYIADTYNHRIRKVNSSGMIQTIAGNGVNGAGSDGIPALTAQLSAPEDVAVDVEGTVYIADTGNDRVRKIASDGLIKPFAGNGTYWNAPGDGGPALQATIWGPSGLAFDSTGNLFIVEYYGMVVRSVTTTGVIKTVAGSGELGFGGDDGPPLMAKFAYPNKIALDTSSNLYVADQDNHRIRKIPAGGGNISTFAGRNHFGGDSGPAASALIQHPRGVALSANKELYIADTGNNRIRVVDSAGNIRTVAGTGEFGYSGDEGNASVAQIDTPGRMLFDSNGRLYFVDQYGLIVRRLGSDGKISTFAGNGRMASSGDGGQARSASFGSITGIAIDDAGNFYVADKLAHKVRKITSGGLITTFAGTGTRGFSGDGGQAANAQLNVPDGLAVDSAGNVYIADSYNQRIRKVSPSGVITTVAGNGQCCSSGDEGPALAARIDPYSLAIDAAGNLYFASTVAVRKIDTAGVITTVAGTGATGFSGDGGAATNGSVWLPGGFALASNGDIYFADTLNNRIRKLEPNPPSKMIMVDGDAQTGPVGTALPKALKVKISGSQNVAVPNVNVTFTVATGQATLSSASAYTDQDGAALVSVTPVKEGALKVTATAGALTVSFNLTATAAVVAPSPAALTITDGDGQTAVVGTAFAKALKVKITTSTGAPVAGVQTTFALTAGQAALSAQTAATGQTGEASITATPSMAGPISIAATAGALSATFKLTGISVDTPIITAGGIVQQGYSTPPVTSISSGAIVTIYGDNFAPKGSAAVFGAASGGVLGSKLAGICVYFGETAAPIFALVPTQVTVQVPKVAPGRVSVQVSRFCGEGRELKSNVETVTAQAATPEFVYVKFNSDGKNPIAAADSVTGQWIGEPGMLAGVNTRPAKAGDYLTLYGVGFGDTTPAVLPGQAATGVAWIAGKAQVTIGGIALSEQDVLYAGFSPGLVGLYQLNLKLPASVPAGNQPVLLRIGEVTSPAGGFLTIMQ